MIRNGQISVADVRRIFRRYWWIVPICVVACTAFGATLAEILPKQYTSQTSVLVDSPTVPQDYVKPVVTDTMDQLASMQEQILSRSRLELVVEKFGLYPAEQAKLSKGELADRLKDAITVAPLAGMPGTTNQLPGFRVSVKFNNPQMAHDICAEVTTMFLNENAKLRESIGNETASFVSQQLNDAKASLDKQDAALAEFKRQHLGYLPEEEQANLQFVASLDTQLDAATQNITRAQQDKAFNQTALDAQESNWKQLESGMPNPDVEADQLASLEEQLRTLLIRYTPEYPDVVKVKAQIADLKKRMAQEPTTQANGERPRTHEPLQIEQLRLKIRQDNTAIAELTKKQAQIEKQISVIEGRVQASPVVEEQFKELTRNYETALEEYKDLLKKQDASRMGNDLERKQEGERFSILDPPSMPTDPSFPKKPYFLGGGFGFGIALSLGVLYALGAMDKSLYSERDVETYLKLPVLTTVPNLDLVSIQSLTGRKH